MRAPISRKLCTLSSNILSHLQNNAKKNLSSIKISPHYEETHHHFHSDLNLSTLKHNHVPPPDEEEDLSGSDFQLSGILTSSSAEKVDCEGVDDEEKEKRVVEIPLIRDIHHSDLSKKRNESSRERKHKWIFKDTGGERSDRLLKICAKKLGTTTTVDVFGYLGRETGVKEYNGLIKLCIKKVRETNDENVCIEEMNKIYNLLKLMRECGFQIEEQTYRPLFEYIIDMGFVQEFELFYDVIKAGNPSSISRLGYYEMLLWMRVNNEEMIRDICEYITVEESKDTFALRESYLLALCESDRKTQILDVLKNIDITKLKSAKSISNIFQSLGRLLLESEAESLLLDLRACDYGADKISNFIASYAVSIPNLEVEDMVLKIENLHDVLEVLLSSSAYEKLILYCCGMHKVDVALDIVDKMCQAGFELSTHVLQSILQICEEAYDYILVHRICSIIRCHHHYLQLNGDICRCLVHFCVRLKDFERAYKMVNELHELGFKPTTAMYNAIMAGYFREKNISGALRVLKHMQEANVKPDSQTFSYLIGNCETKDDINMYRDEMTKSEIKLTKQIYMALVNAYAACGEFEEAKKVVDDQSTSKSLNEIKSVLVSALASHGRLSEALVIYKEIKKAGHNLEPKAVISLIDAMRYRSGELDRLLLLLMDLSDQNYWVDGCFRVIQYCVQNNHLSTTVDLLKQLKDTFESDETMTEVLFDAAYSLIAGCESTHLQFGLDLLWAIKDELGLVPSRQCLDFLLRACAISGDLNNARLIWREYEVAGFPYNVLSYLRMYQALLASGDHRSADFILKKIPRDDADVCSIILECQKTYGDNVKSGENVKSVEGDKKKKSPKSVGEDKKKKEKKKKKKKKKETGKKENSKV